jgi:hypothetical protein
MSWTSGSETRVPSDLPKTVGGGAEVRRSWHCRSAHGPQVQGQQVMEGLVPMERPRRKCLSLGVLL